MDYPQIRVIHGFMQTRHLIFYMCFVLSTLFLASACGGSAGTIESSATSQDVNTFLQELINKPPLLSYEELVGQLGPPVRVRTEVVPGQTTDTLRTVFYYGLELALHEGTAPARLTHLALTDARYTSPEGLRVGYAESQILSTLGLPARREAARLTYENERPQPFTLVVLLERHAVSRLEWHFR